MDQQHEENAVVCLREVAEEFAEVQGQVAEVLQRGELLHRPMRQTRRLNSVNI